MNYLIIMLKKTDTSTNIFKAALVVVMLLFVFALVRTAWIGDDAFITFRTIDNFINGHGLVWNIGEKVQTYTHPLWMLILSGLYYFSHELYFTTIFFSIGLSIIAIYALVFKMQKNIIASLITSTLLIGSQAFIDFSTSGLENPLTNILIVAFIIMYFSGYFSLTKKAFALSLITSLAMVNRLDLCLLFVPALLYFIYKNWNWRRVLIMAIGTLPTFGWLLFAWQYYGFILPNTYYAKLFTGIPLASLIYQGLIYCFESIHHDPVTLCTVIGGVALLWAYKQYQSLWLSLGAIIYIIYVITNGGDFMSGRFFVAPFVLVIGAIQPLLESLTRQIKINIETPIVLGIATLILCTTTIAHFSKEEADASVIPLNGIANERLFYFPTNGLINQVRGSITPPHSWALYGLSQKNIAETVTDHKAVVTFPCVGMLGFFAGPNVYIIDQLALTDSFLAHQPMAKEQETNWRIGHFIRDIPEGYVESKMYGQNMIKDPKLHALYDQIENIITR